MTFLQVADFQWVATGAVLGLIASNSGLSLAPSSRPACGVLTIDTFGAPTARSRPPTAGPCATSIALWKPPGANRLRDVHAALDSAVRTASRMSATEDTLAFLLALNLELADEGAKGVQLTPPGPPVPADEAKEFMSKDCVTVREGERVR